MASKNKITRRGMSSSLTGVKPGLRMQLERHIHSIRAGVGKVDKVKEKPDEPDERQ